MKNCVLAFILIVFLFTGCAGGTWGTGVRPRTFNAEDDQTIGDVPLRKILNPETALCTEKDVAEGKEGCQ